MAECDICGEKVMGFSCSYCGGTYCSDHRLPENHECDNLEEEVEKQKEQNLQWFEEKNLKEETADKKRPLQSRRKPTIVEDIFRSLSNNYVLLIIGITVLSFYLQNISGYEQLFILNADIFGNITGEPGLIHQPWTLITVMLLHGGIFHLFVNMLTFYFFGTPVEKIIGSKKTVIFYLLSGIFASIVYVISRNIMWLIHGSTLPGGGEVFMPAVGASGAVIAFVGMVAMLYPRSDVLLFFVIPMKIKTAVYGFGIFETFNLLTTLAGYPLPIVGMFASSAHLAGLAVGIWYGKKLQDKYKRNTSVFDPMTP